jgi:triphosphoribosyl-dephospho-CoA synthase
LFETALPALQASLAQGLGPQRARLQTLFQVMAVLDDTNLARRGSLAGLRYAQRAAREWLHHGGVTRPDALAHARALHREFVARRLSPGGAADVLAAACWVQRVRVDVP